MLYSKYECMRNIFTKTPDDFGKLSKETKEEKLKMEPDKEVLMFISQFAKVYYVERQLGGLAFASPMILN
jgi:hypothetical protein